MKLSMICTWFRVVHSCIFIIIISVSQTLFVFQKPSNPNWNQAIQIDIDMCQVFDKHSPRKPWLGMLMWETVMSTSRGLQSTTTLYIKGWDRKTVPIQKKNYTKKNQTNLHSINSLGIPSSFFGSNLRSTKIGRSVPIGPLKPIARWTVAGDIFYQRHLYTKKTNICKHLRTKSLQWRGLKLYRRGV